jgi:peptide/nickel transport system substrate-binding protein
VALVAASTAPGAADEPPVGGTIKSAWVGSGTAETIDPTTWLTLMELARISAVFDRLTYIDETGRPQPMLAESLEPNADASVWTVRLRPDVTFHDGSPLTAEDVLYSYQSAMERGFFAAGVFGMIDVANSSVVDDLTVEFVLETPNAEFDRVVADPSGSIIKAGTTDFTETVIGTGPYVMEEWVAGVRTDLVRFEDYWGDPANLDRLELIEINDETARINALMSGQIDLAVNIPPFFADQLEAAPGFSVAYDSGTTAPIIYMRQDTPPFDQLAVRQAMRLAIDRQKCVDVALAGRGTVGNDLFGPTYPSYADDIPQRSYDPERARSLLDEAGIGELSVELVTAPGVGMLECAAVFKESAQAAGIEITLRQVSAADIYNPESVYLQVPFGPSEWKGVSFQEHARMSLLQSSYANETANADPEFDAAFAEAEATLDDAERNAKYAALQRELWDEGGYIVWGIQQQVIAFNDKVGGYDTLAGPSIGFLPPGLEDLWIRP